MTGRRERALLVGLVAGGGYGALLRPRLRRWGATDAEVAAPYPGAHLVPGGNRGATMAATIDAPPPQVWPWLVQMGCDRAGWYSWDRLDHGGISSETRIHPEWQHIQVGDRLASTPSGNAWFEVAALEPQRFLRSARPWTSAAKLGPSTPPARDLGSTATQHGASFLMSCRADARGWWSAGTQVPGRVR